MANPETVHVEVSKQEVKIKEFPVSTEVPEQPKAVVSEPNDTPQLSKVSALSLSSIRAKRELEKNKSTTEKQHVDLPTEPFSETDMLLIWTKFAENKGHKGQKIIVSALYEVYFIFRHYLPKPTAIQLCLYEPSSLSFEGPKNSK